MSEGISDVNIVDRVVSLDQTSIYNIMGRGMILYALEDNFNPTRDPDSSGGAGAQVGCCLIVNQPLPITTTATTQGTQATQATQATTQATSRPSVNPGETCPLEADLSGVTKGDITWYQPYPTGGNCDLNWASLQSSGLDGWTHFAALPKSDDSAVDRYESGANCGRCVRVRCSCDQAEFPGACQAGGTESILMIVDSCPTCTGGGDIDTSTAAWNSITGDEAVSRFEGTWDYVECPARFVSGSTRIRVKPGSSEFWYAFQPVAHRHQITKIEMTMNGSTTALSFGEIDGFWWLGEIEITATVTVTVTNSNGQVHSVEVTKSDVTVANKELTLTGSL